VARSRRRLWRKIFIVIFVVLATVAVVAAAWIMHLDRVVTRQFQGRHWSVPAHVYAAPL
jgi:hypothetical protein